MFCKFILIRDFVIARACNYLGKGILMHTMNAYGGL